jgi:hypothetical protein
MTRALLLAGAFALSAGAAAAQLHVAKSDPPKVLMSSAPAPVLPDLRKVVARGDAVAFAKAEFAYADADRNAALTRTEYLALEKERVKIPTLNHAAPLTAFPGAEAPKPPYAPLAARSPDQERAKTPEERFAALAGAAKFLNLESFVAARVAQFDAADADANGELTRIENAAFARRVAG